MQYIVNSWIYSANKKTEIGEGIPVLVRQ